MARKHDWPWIIAAIAAASVLAIVLWALFSYLTVWRLNSRTEPTGSSSSGATSEQASQVNFETGSHAYTMQWDGQERSYRVFVPQGLSGSVPLVVMLHGGGGSGAHAEKVYGWDQLAAKEGFIVAYPSGLGAAVSAWNVEGGGDSDRNCCGQSARTGVDDVGFVLNMVKTIQASLPIDADRVYAAGMSNGAILSYTLACDSDVFAAIGPTSGTMLVDCKNPNPVSVIAIHGMLDTSVPFDGSKGSGMAGIDGPPIESVISTWRSIDSCAAPSSSTEGVVTTSIAQCANGRTVELITVADAGHGWPGTPPSEQQGSVPTTTAPIESTQVIWQFFASHPKG